MATLDERVELLHREVVERLGAGQALIDARAEIGDASTIGELRAAVDAYIAIVDAGGSTVFEDVVAEHLDTVPALQQIVRTVVDGARRDGRDASATLRLGPARLDITAPGATASVEGRRFVVGHLAVDGVAIDVNAGGLSARGAGTVPPRAELGGILAATLGPVDVTLAVLVGTDPVNAHTSVLGLLRAEFRPTGLQLGFGFSLDAVGGLVGVNRSADVDEMRARLADGSALDALFGGTIANAAGMRRTLGALEQMFPRAPGSFIVGPTLRLAWMTIGTWSFARIDAGVIVELPSGRVVVPARAVLEVPGPGIPLVHLRLDAIGEIDVAGSRLALDAALVDSTVLGALRVGGTAAVRLCWGDPGMALVTVGGFHPNFDPRPADVPPQKRITIALANPIPAGLDLHAEGYVAAGSGTLQLGGRLDVACEVAGCGIRGSGSIDALVQFAPLWFTAGVAGRVSLRALGRTVASVDLRGRLTGPGPLVLRVEATTEVFGIDVGGGTSFVLSSAGGSDRAPAATLLDAVVRQLRDPSNVSAEGGGDRLVVTAPRPRAGAALLAFGSAVVWSQEAFPLGQPVEKADGRLLAAPAVVGVTTAPVSSAVTRSMPTAAFMDLTDSEVLTVPQFAERPAGLRLTAQPRRADGVDVDTAMYREYFAPAPVFLGLADRAAFMDTFGSFHEMLASAALVQARRTSLGVASLSSGVDASVVVTAEEFALLEDGIVIDSVIGGASAHAVSTMTVGASAIPAAAAKVVFP